MAALGLAACQAQASEGYLGEPLLSLSGHATVNTPTNGEVIELALCFYGNNSVEGYQDFDGSFLPDDIRGVFDRHPYAWHDAGAVKLSLVDVESQGEFPADFHVEAYLPPPDGVVEATFKGEPRVASGTICAVRADHLDEAEMPFYSTVKDCDDGDDGQCKVSFLWATRKTKRYYAEFYQCTNAQSDLHDCVLTTAGDAGLRREPFEFVLGRGDVTLLYAGESVSPDSFAGWSVGASKTLAPGYHLFVADDPSDKSFSKCVNEANRHSSDELLKVLQERKAAGDPPSTEEIQELSWRAQAKALREECDRPELHEVRGTESLSIEINRTFETIDPRP